MRFTTLLLMAFGVSAAALADNSIDDLHDSAIVIDAHSDFLDRSAIDGSRLNEDPPFAQTTLSTLQQGNIDAQFFSVFVPPAFEQYGFAKRTFELMDRLALEVAENHTAIEMAYSPADIRRIAATGKVAALMGIEGGHSIEHNLALLRTYHRLGVRYMTLTWDNTNTWADAAEDASKWGGLNDFGVQVIREMNRLGMMIDISHISDDTFWEVMETTTAPVIASHSLVRAIRNTPHNMSDDMIRAVANNGGVIHMSFYAKHVSERFAKALDAALAEAQPRFDELEEKYRDDPIQLDAELWSLEKHIERQLEPPTVSDVVEHINHIVKLVGVDYVGLGSDFDGLGIPPKGLSHVGEMRNITHELHRQGYTQAEIRKILGDNFMRVFEQVTAH